MEQRGASDVVSVDLDVNTHAWDMVPFADPAYDLEASIEQRRRELRAIHDGYWLAHRLLQSRARVYYGTGYDLPAALGQFDVVLIGMMLPHVRDPFKVLEQATSRAEDTIIITQQAPQMPNAWAYFMPDAANLGNFAFWWSLSEDCVERMLGVLGFQLVSRTRVAHACVSRAARSEECTTYVAERRIGRRQGS